MLFYWKEGFMNNEDFIFLRIMMELNKYIRRLLPNFPKKESVLKNSMEKNLYEMFECIFSFNIQTTPRLKEKYLKDFSVKLAMLDIYVKDAYHAKYISSKQMKAIANKEIDLKKICVTLMKGIKKNG